MIARLFPASLRGEVTAPPSKSDAQRLLIAAWLAGDIDRVQLNGAQSADIAACVRCLHALGTPEPCLDCGDSGAVLRFLTPVAAALGGDVRTISLLTPNGGEFYSPESMHTGIHSQKAMIERCYDAMDDAVVTVDAYTGLRDHADEYIYFRTDHHWTQLGAY